MTTTTKHDPPLDADGQPIEKGDLVRHVASSELDTRRVHSVSARHLRLEYGGPNRWLTDAVPARLYRVVQKAGAQ